MVLFIFTDSRAPKRSRRKTRTSVAGSDSDSDMSDSSRLSASQSNTSVCQRRSTRKVSQQFLDKVSFWAKNWTGESVRTGLSTRLVGLTAWLVTSCSYSIPGQKNTGWPASPSSTMSLLWSIDASFSSTKASQHDSMPDSVPCNNYSVTVLAHYNFTPFFAFAPITDDSRIVDDTNSCTKPCKLIW